MEFSEQNPDVNFSGDFLVGFFCREAFFPWKKNRRKNPPKNPPQNANQNLGVLRSKSIRISYGKCSEILSEVWAFVLWARKNKIPARFPARFSLGKKPRKIVDELLCARRKDETEKALQVWFLSLFYSEGIHRREFKHVTSESKELKGLTLQPENATCINFCFRDSCPEKLHASYMNIFIKFQICITCIRLWLRELHWKSRLELL